MSENNISINISELSNISDNVSKIVDIPTNTSVINNISDLSNSFSNMSFPNMTLMDFSFTEYIVMVKPLLFFVVAITLYSFFVFKFYRFLAKRDILEWNLHEYSEGMWGFLKFELSFFLYVLETLILIPLVIFFWFATLTTFLLFLGKNHSPETLLLTAMSIVASVRICAYYSEDLAKDLAKMVPFALLGIFMVDISYISLESSIDIAKQIPALWKHLTYYLIFVVGLEFILRSVNEFFKLIFKKNQEPEEEIDFRYE